MPLTAFVHMLPRGKERLCVCVTWGGEGDVRERSLEPDRGGSERQDKKRESKGTDEEEGKDRRKRRNGEAER